MPACSRCLIAPILLDQIQASRGLGGDLRSLA